MKYCTKCGHQNNDAESFCINCGTSFGVEETTDGSQVNSKNMVDNIISGVKKTTV